MAKVLNTYRAFTASDINGRMSDTCDHSVVGSTVECTNVKMSKVNTVLGASTYSLAALCAHANINHWSGFGPTVRSISSQTVVNSNPASNYSLGSFAGYNHNATAPYISADTSIVVVNNGAGFEITADVYIGEARWYEELNIMGVALAIYEGATFVAADVVALSSISDSANLSVSCGGVNSDRTYTGKLYFINNASSFNEAYILARIPNCSDFNIDITVLAPDWLDLQAGSFTVNNAGFSATTGYIGCSSAVSAFDDPALEIWARVISQETGLIEQILLWSGAYTANTYLYGLGDNLDNNYSVPYPGYGYQFQLAFEASS